MFHVSIQSGFLTSRNRKAFQSVSNSYPEVSVVAERELAERRLQVINVGGNARPVQGRERAHQIEVLTGVEVPDNLLVRYAFLGVIDRPYRCWGRWPASNIASGRSIGS